MMFVPYWKPCVKTTKSDESLGRSLRRDIQQNV